jgi:alpha-L-rhamnosidase
LEKEWRAGWIKDRDFAGMKPIDIFHKQGTKKAFGHREDLKNRHMLARKKIFLSEKPERSVIDITADDYYKLFINGTFVGQGPSPSFYFHYFYNSYDVSGFLKKGDNVIAVHVYYQGLINRVWTSGDYRQGFIAELFVDGRLCAMTDRNWKCIKALEFTGKRTTGYDTQFIEDIDSRLKICGWKNAEFDDDCWDAPFESADDDHRFFLQPTPPLEVYEIKPETVGKTDEGGYLIDFGHEITGQLKFKARGISGQNVSIKCGEELEDDPSSMNGKVPHVRSPTRSNCDYDETWTLSGEDDTLEYYDYKAFRYAEIKLPENVSPMDICVSVRHYPFDGSACIFRSSDDSLNRIWEICVNAVRYGSQEIYVDCPGREKGQYAGDAFITAQSHSYLTGDHRLYKKVIGDFARSSFICPGLMAVSPSGFMQEIADYSLLWPAMLLNYFERTGDREFLEKMHPVAEGLIGYFRKFSRDDGLLENLNEKWNLVDWPDNLRDGYDFKLDPVAQEGCHNVVNAFYIGATRTVNRIRDVLGMRYDDNLNWLKDSYAAAFYDGGEKLFRDSTVSSHHSFHSNVLALYFDLSPAEASGSIIDLIVRKRLCCGVYFSYFVLKALAKSGEHELVYDLLTSNDDHSWNNMVKEGATSAFEAWGKDQKWNTSLCHPWASSPIIILIEDILGIKPVMNMCKDMTFEPHIPRSLDHLYARIPMYEGNITIESEKGRAKIDFHGEA